MYWTCNSTNDLLSYSGLIDARMSVSDKKNDLYLLEIELRSGMSVNQLKETPLILTNPFWSTVVTIGLLFNFSTIENKS